MPPRLDDLNDIGTLYTVDATRIYTGTDLTNQWTADRFVYPAELTVSNELNNKFEEFAHKIYNIISEYTKIDITEDEFMEIIRSE